MSGLARALPYAAVPGGQTARLPEIQNLPQGRSSEADPDHNGIALWDKNGKIILTDRKGRGIPYSQTDGFTAPPPIFPPSAAPNRRKPEPSSKPSTPCSNAFRQASRANSALPLAALKIQTEVLAISEPDEQPHHLRQIIERAERLINQLLALSKLDPEHGISDAQPIDWASLSSQVLQNTNLAALEKRIRLKRELSDHPLPLSGNNELLQLMLRNLLGNAARYSPENSEILLRIPPSASKCATTGRRHRPAASVQNQRTLLPPRRPKQTGQQAGAFHRRTNHQTARFGGSAGKP